MRRIGRLRAFALLGMAASAALTACGPAHNVISGKSAQQILDGATSSSAATPARFTIHGSVAIDAGGLSNVRPTDIQSFGTFTQGLTLDGTGSVENAQRVAVTLRVPPLCPGPLYLTTYDGITYVSGDASAWAQLPGLGGNLQGAGSSLVGGLGISPLNLSSLTKAGINLTDVGSEQLDGQAVEHLHADFDQQIVSTLLGNGGQNALPRVFSSLLQFKSGGYDIYVRASDGRLDRIRANAVIALNFSLLVNSLGRATPSPGNGIPGGTLPITVNFDLQMTDYSSGITVTRPSIAGAAPTTPLQNCGLGGDAINASPTTAPGH